MGILRADRITGLGGANAITGSCFFDVKNYLLISHDISLDGDFTIEWWTHRTSGVTNSDWFTIGDSKNSTGLELYIGSSGSSLVLYSNNGSIITANSGSPSQEVWHHMAVVRSSNTIKIYVDGTADSTTVSNSSTFSGDLHLGVEYYNGSATVRSKMHMSNFRILKGTALYTANFTPPNTRLENISGTSILCCQSPGDVTQEATGKTITAERSGSATTSANVQASRFTPNSPVGFSTTTDVGTQFGSTFDGVTTFDSQAYMVPPGGNTRERNRGRGVSFGGDNNTTSILFVDIQSQGNAQDFGDLTAATVASPGACASSTRGLYGGGTPSNTNVIGFITIANTANAADFGDLTQARRQLGGCSNDTRGLFGSGRVSDPVNTIDFVTIATTGDASDFGDVTTAARYLGSTSSTTRGFWFGGNTPTATNVINFVTIATTGDASDFGDLTEAKPYPTGCSSSTRAITFGGMVSAPNYVNTIEFFTMASTGNATDFGDCIEPNGNSSGMSNLTRGVRFAGAVVSGSYTNSIDFINIATTGNASDFGDFITAGGDGAGTSDSHGGLE